jgi:hypothetical protein
MHRRKWWLVAAVIVVPLLFAACGGSGESSEPAPPATVQQVKGTDVFRITLSADAARRIALRTAPVMADEMAAHLTQIPYSAVFYAPDGQTWTYVSETPLTFMRHRITVDRIEGKLALLSSGPKIGTKVATVGVAELYGTETDVGE